MAADPLDRQAGVYAKGLRLINGKKFKALPEDNKQSVLRQYYKTYVEPAYAVSHITPPDEDTWVKGMSIKGGPSMTVEDFYLNRGAPDALADFKSSALNMGASATKVLGNLIRGATIAGIKVPTKFFGLQAYFNAPEDDSWKSSMAGVLQKIQDNPLMRMSQDTIDNSNFWLASRPTRTYSEMAGSFIGEQGAQLPIYEAVGAVGKGAALLTKANKLLQVGAVAENAGTIAKAANFTRRLAASPAGRMIGKRLSEGAEGYIGGVIQGEGSLDAKKDAISFMALGIIGADLGTVGKELGATPLLRGTRSGMKKLLAEQAAIGGLPLVQAVQNQAIHELNNNIVGTGHSGEPLIAQPHHVPADIKEGLGIAKQADPVKHNMVAATKLTFLQLAKEKYGPDTIWKNLARSKQDAVRAELAKRTAQAVEEIPLHVPEVAEHEIKKDIKSDIELSPRLAQTYADIEQRFKVNIPNAVAKQEREAIKTETGLKSDQGAVEKVAKKTEALAKVKASGAPKRGPRTREDEVFQDFSDYGMSKYNYRDESFNIQFASKADRALYNTRKSPMHYASVNKPLPPTYHATVAKLKEYFPGKTAAELHAMKEEVKSKVDAAVKERRAHPEYKAGTMKYGANIRIDPIHGETTDISEIADTKKELLETSKDELENFSQTLEAFKTNYPEAYKSGLDVLVQLQAARNALETKK